MEKILIIDDDPALIDFLKVLLESEGYETFSAADGENGLREIGTRQPDLVLLDYQLPDMNGLEVLSQTNQAYEKALVVMLTGKGSEEVAVECMKAGAADYVVKPFDNQRLVSVIREALSAREELQRVKSTLIKIRGESRD